MCILYWASMIPEWREVLRLERAGDQDRMKQAREVQVVSRSDQGTVRKVSASDLVSALVSRFKHGARSDS
jgi:hypothetical protein